MTPTLPGFTTIVALRLAVKRAQTALFKRTLAEAKTVIQDQTADIASWLSSLGLSQYHGRIVETSGGELAAVRTLSEEDLELAGFDSAEDRRKLLAAAAALPDAPAAAASSQSGRTRASSVVCADPPLTGAALDKHNARRIGAARELLSTEIAYVRTLSKMVAFLAPLRIAALRSVPSVHFAVALSGLAVAAMLTPRLSAARPVIPPTIALADYHSLALNIEALLAVHERIVARLTPRLEAFDPATTAVGDVFEEVAGLFRCYALFVLGYGDALATVTRLRANVPAFDAYCQGFRADPDLGGGLEFAFCLLEPVQRLMRYPMMLAGLAEHTRRDHPDFSALCGALVKTSAVARLIDRQEKNWTRVKRLAALLTWYTGPPVAVPGRRLHHDGVVYEQSMIPFGRKRYAYLFTGLLIVTKKKGKDGHAYAVYGFIDLTAAVEAMERPEDVISEDAVAWVDVNAATPGVPREEPAWAKGEAEDGEGEASDGEQGGSSSAAVVAAAGGGLFPFRVRDPKKRTVMYLQATSESERANWVHSIRYQYRRAVEARRSVLAL